MLRGRGGGGGRTIRKRWMASKKSIKILLTLLTAITLASFAPALTPLPVLSSSRHHLSSGNARGFWIADDMFWKDGRPFQIIGGDVHYFRVLPEYWEDRLLRAKALGLNTIQTYVPWNLHEPEPQKWVFEGIADIESFLKLAQELGFLVMLRAGPYICAEWDFGGFPAWLLAIEPALKLRSSDPEFLQLVERWWGVLLPKMSPLLYENGGPIIMVQVENEFGSYGDDKKYLHHLVTLARRHLGNDIVLYTTDGGSKDALEKGTIPEEGVFSAVDFSTGDNPWPIFKLQKKYNAPGKSPALSSEFYTGWLTHWGEQIAETGASFTAAALQTILSRNGSAVLYMAHGGTNFEFFNGANTGQNESDYKADLTSYDYDAPIKESGDVDNPKFKALRRVIEKYSSVALPPVPSNNKRASYGLFKMFGFVLYVTEYSQKETSSILSIPKVRDRAQVFVSCSIDDKGSPRYVGVIERWSNKALAMPKITCSSNISLFVLVENLGRVNYGPYMYDRKGILSPVILDNIVLHRWKMHPISFQRFINHSKDNPIMQVANSRINKISIQNSLKDHSSRFSFSLKESISEEPGFYKGHFYINSINQVRDTFISFRGWSKGVAFVNNFNIGRFWPLFGPQCTLYVPAPILQHGENVVVILELHAPNPDLTIELVENPDFTCGPKLHHK
ncbi:beta-galactosidase 8 isoform X2 [Phoenix dactylifera]|uniref:Beta-galactosidase n=1 Tax=Phoenix dactylifera TaxID=42345 RepID=A0A8B9ATF0_PHODC|nr:beta-galactosidase 8 isoform X2 [Phoenix dactylifera]